MQNKQGTEKQTEVVWGKGTRTRGQECEQTEQEWRTVEIPHLHC